MFKLSLAKWVLLSGMFAVCLLGWNQAQALTIGPAKVEIEVDAGNVVRDKMTLINDEEREVTYYSLAELFEAQGEGGTPNFVASETGLSSWIETVDKITLQPNETVEVPYTIRVPVDADPGGHFAALFWTTLAPDAGQDGGQVMLGSKIGMLILLRVNGEVEEGGGVLEFSTLGDKKLFTSLPIKFFYRFQNDGGDRLRPIGDITVRNIFGGKASVLNANPTEGNILPGSVRKYEILWSEKTKEANYIHTEKQDESKGYFAAVKSQWSNFLFGYYSAHIAIAYGEEDLVDNEKYSFFIIPWQLLSLVFSILVLVGFGGRTLLVRYNRMIIAQAKKGASRKK